MKKNHSFFTNNLCSTKWMRMLLMSFMLLLSSSLYATTFYIQGDSWLKLSNSNTTMTASSNIYSYTFTSENTGEGKWFKIFKDGSGDSNMLCYSGSDKNVPLNTTRSCTIGGSYTEFKMSVEKGVIYTITVTYTSNANVKLIITAIEPIVITPNKEAPYYLKDEITLTATGGKGGVGDYQWYKKEPSESSYTQISGENNASYSFTLDGSYTYKVVDTTTGVESIIEIKPSVRCDEDNTKVIFSEDFGWLDIKERAESEYAKYTYKGACTSIKNGGEYAIVAVPVWGGCNVIGGDDYGNPCWCPAYSSQSGINMWFNEKLDHATEEKYINSLKTENSLITDDEIQTKLVTFRKDFATTVTDDFRKTHTAAPAQAKDNNKLYGGMLLFNCKGGSDDILYERKIDVCDNTYINFSAWFTKANVSNADNIGAKFVLLNGSTRGELDSYIVENIDVNAGWKQVSAMFNSKNCGGSVIVQLINYAPAGDNGNDLLVDDISLSICTPEASLHADYAGNQTDNVRAMIDENVDLISGIDNVIFSGSPFYWWQKKEEGSANWTPLTTNPVQNKATYQVSVTNKKTEYRVIVANTSQAAKDAADNLNSDDLCGLYSVTNSVLVEPILLTLTPSRESESICSDDDNTLTLTVKNTSSVAINDVYAQVIIPDGLKAYKYGTETAFDGKWKVGNLVANTGTATLKITLKPVNAVTTITSYVIKSYISAIGTNLSWTSYDNAVIKKDISFNVKPVPGKPTFVLDKFYEECALTGDNTDVYFSTLIKGTGLKVYSNKELTNAVEYFAGATPTNKTYYANLTVDGCTGDTVQFPVTVLELPKLKLAKTDVPSICGTESDSKATLTYEIEGGTAPYTLSIQGTKEGGATETITPSGLSTTGTYTLQPTTKTTYTFTKVADVNGCYSESSTGLVNDITIKVVNLEIVKGIGDSTVCADKTIEYSITAKGDNIKYRWFESKDNEEFKQVKDGSENTYKTDEFKLGDNKKYKVEVYQDPEVCNAKQSESIVTVQDCSELSLTSNVISPSVCMGGEITLNYTITNNNASEEAKDVEVSIINLSKQELKDNTYTASQGTYLHSSGVWNVGTLAAGTKATLSITVKGATVVKNDEITAYISKSGSTSYDVDATETIKAPNFITVMKYSEKPTLISETYKGCPVDGKVDLKSQIATPIDKTTLTFYTDKSLSATATATHVDKNEVGTTPYYVTNKLDGECESDTTHLKIVVYPQPTAKISGTTSICSSESTDLKIDLTGTPDYKITLSDGTEKPATESITIPVSPTTVGDHTYTLSEVIDGHNCKATITGEAVITVNSAPSITINADGNLPADICAGQKYQLPSVTVTNNGSGVTSEGWYLGGNKITLDEGKYYTFSLEEDNDKSLVYKAVNGCGETTEEFESNLVVKDCANFTITYSLDKKQVCKGDEVVLTATITNNSDSNLRDVILSQSWDGSQIASKDAAGTNKKIFVTSGDVSSEYDEDNNIWKIGTFTALKSAILTITFSAQADESFHIYMKESNDVTYQDDAKNPTSKTDDLEVLEISNPVALDATKNYNGICPRPSSEIVNLSDLVTRNATDTLHFYDKDKILLTAEPTFDISTEIPSTIYYINRTEAGKCISNNPIPVTIEVYKPVTASIAATKNTICSGTESDVNITVDGTAGFTIVYNNGVDDITKPISGKTLNIAETLTSTTTYKLISVTDAHECEAKLDGTESVTITVNALPELVSFDIEDSDKIICDGESTKLKATFTGKAPFKFYINDVETESEDAEWSMDITEGKTYAIKQLSDDNCDSKLTQKDVTLTVESSPVVELDATNVTLNCNNPKATITASGANSYNWSYTDQDGVEQTQTGDKLNVQLSESGQVNSSTTYTVYGYSEKAKCKSASPVTVTITENKRTPVVSDLVSVNSQDETIEGYKETQIINCKDTELFIKSTIVDNVAAGYSPDDLTYDWAISEDGDLYEAYGVGETISTKTQGIFRLIVTDNETGCSSAAKRIEITENKTTPVITVVESVTTKDPSASEAVKTSVLTCEYPVLYLTPTIESENEVSYLWNNESTEDYLEVSEAGTYTLVVTDNVSFCSTEEYTYIVTQDNTAPTFNVDATYYLCPSDVVTEKTLSSLLPATPGVTYKFYNEAGEEIKDLYEISADASVTEYYVTGISDNGCESTKTMFSVDYAKNVDFTLTTSQTSMLVGGNETVVTIVPDADSEILDAYTWLVNGNEVDVDGLEHSSNLYIDTKFEVTATNRCDSDTKEAFVEVLWPTAFTPHNDNGKNEDFAKGMYIIVFNRFYTKIFEGPDGWDGTINGTMNESEQIAVPGVYYYSVKLPNGEVKKGTVEIVNVD